MPRTGDQEKRKQRGSPTLETKEKRAKSKNDRSRSASAAGFNSLFQQRSSPKINGIGDSGITASDSNISTASATTSSASSSTSSSQRPSRCERRDASHQPDIIAEHEDDDQLIDEHTLDSVMNRYIRAVQLHVEDEISNPTKPRILLDILKENDWWLRSIHGRKICVAIGFPELFDEPSYIRDIYIWLPDVRWGHEAIPPCPNCFSSDRVGVHGFRKNHFGRRIYHIDTHYFVVALYCR